MPEEHHFPVDPWMLREIGLDAGTLAQSESLFALSNGHIGVRGNLDEGDPNGLPGTYLNSFYESRPLPYAESGYGYPESGQTVLNVTNGKLIRLLLDDEPFDLRYGELIHHERMLDLRDGVLGRWVEWQSPAGTRVRLHTTRIVSLVRRSILAIRYRVEPVDTAIRVVVQSELVANEPLPAQSKDPRVSALIANPLEAVLHGGSAARATLVHRTRSSDLQLAAAVDHVVEVEGPHREELQTEEDWARYTVGTVLEPGQHLTLTKFVSYGWSSERSATALRDQVEAALLSATFVGWDQVLDEQANHMHEFWTGADIEIDGAPEIQQAARFSLFHSYQASARSEQRAIPAKGLTGPGYDGHSFWDTEAYVLPLLTATAPHAAADALRWRHSILDLAIERAETLRLAGAAFPWRTIRGQECSAYWPAGTAALHINADVAVAAARYVWWTEDEPFERDYALPLLVHTARLWAAYGYDGDDEKFHIDGVTGPDEYTAIVDDNAYTNLMAKQNLEFAVTVAGRHPDAALALDVTDEELKRWAGAAARMALPYDETRGVHQQDRGFTDRAVWDFERSARDDEYPLLLHVPYLELYRTQVIKQADLVLAMHWAGDAFTEEEKARNFAYYDPLTVRDSSLSACTQAVLAAEVGHLELAANYLGEAAMMDLRDLEHNSGDGLHIASLAGAWLAIVAGFGGLRDMGERLRFRPQLPPGWRRLRFAIRRGGGRLLVEITPDQTEYRFDGPHPIEITHLSGADQEVVTIVADHPQHRPWTAVQPRTDPPEPPAGRPVEHTDAC